MKKSILIFVIALFVSSIFGQAVLSYSGSENYTLVERTNLRRYDNGKYTGLMSREIRSFITCEKNRNGDIYYSGDFFVSQDTVRAQKIVFDGIHESIPSRFIINEFGAMKMEEDNGYPSFRSFPSFPRDPVKIGETWKGESVRAIDPLNNGTVTKIPMTILYKLLGEEIYHGVPVYRISAEWATRYGISYWDFGGDKNLKSAQGSHKATILVSCETGAAIFMTDTVDETFVYADGNKVNFKGTILQFTEYPPSVETEEILPALKRVGAVAKADTKDDVGTGGGASGTPIWESRPVGGSGSTSGKSSKKKITSLLPKQTDSDDFGKNKITVEETDAGIKLSIHDLKFKADSSELLPGEEKRLDEIASVLKLVPKSMLLVEGHTADTGYPAGELMLSKQRAIKIAEELSKRGINADKFICKGSGATKPIADNTTTEGKAKNRRVEITILN